MSKDELLKVRVSKGMKAAISRLARSREESESVVIREALAAYIEAKCAQQSQEPLKPDSPKASSKRKVA